MNGKLDKVDNIPRQTKLILEKTPMYLNDEPLCSEDVKIISMRMNLNECL